MINIREKLNIGELSSYLAYANTPNFLFNNFLLDKGIYDISKKIDEPEYLSYFNDFLNKEEYSLEDFVIIYALVFSSIHKERKETLSILNHELIGRIKWGNHLKQIILNNQKINSSTSFNFEIKPNLNIIPNTTSNITVTNIKIENHENTD